MKKQERKFKAILACQYNEAAIMEDQPILIGMGTDLDTSNQLERILTAFKNDDISFEMAHLEIRNLIKDAETKAIDRLDARLRKMKLI